MLKLHAERSLPILFTMGFMVHLINLSTYLRNGKLDPGLFMSPMVDAALFAVMLYSSIALIWEHKVFFKTYGFDKSAGRKIGYWFITYYVTASIPGHIYYMYTADSSYFAWFPWWFSPLIMTVYCLMIWFCFSLKPKTQS
ncbi:hypothetical protein IQB76_10745 [Leptospira borgpetersenii serovar Hardjo-bovis]|uniref:Uncharacterized protein n=1 Tax=Leptospira borgpetersenii serovar Hardjo-bovis str. Sponselee TaxID=1303729 RepID=M6BDC2_LEPBO|nr:hypothetical protein [Leptospira borgpetersenii]ABJ77957.1 Hypothetical protein LBL_0349 [Leptospira borgpetersenii serovar Hardjo-bovis str. L550]AMX57191.1 hypothetical protein LBK6_01895 [Leptospira borgpetersenii serovar Hardjo]AMX60422.1 hypothetical protein LBK9_01890 [Leptospira borgpetersenii serovar Hardjo]AMX63669.1 hypothetical protein LBK30_01910 [Leptospira borgpetersenii serovar Hardjo]AMX66908.1 hypothetical protein LBHA_01910 [Leptospira borgpetersenii serovar Hardjo]